MDARDKQALRKTILWAFPPSFDFYNHKRPHSSRDARTPDQSLLRQPATGRGSMNFAAAGGQPRQQPAEDPSVGSETLFRRSRPPQVTSGYRRLRHSLWDPSSRCRSLAPYSARAQIVMESLPGEIVAARAQFCRSSTYAVPPTQSISSAQHLSATIAARRLMGADCICSGIRPQIAQIIVQLGLDLTVTSKATMADAFAMALRRVKGPSRIARILPSCNIRLRHVFPDAACGPAQRRAISRLPLRSRRPLQYLSHAAASAAGHQKLSDQGKNRRSRRALITSR